MRTLILFNIVLEGLVNAIRQQQEIKIYKSKGKRKKHRIKLANNMNVNVLHPKESIKSSWSS